MDDLHKNLIVFKENSRRIEILEMYGTSHSNVTIDDLSNRLEVSKPTVITDIKYLSTTIGISKCHLSKNIVTFNIQPAERMRIYQLILKEEPLYKLIMGLHNNMKLTLANWSNYL